MSKKKTYKNSHTNSREKIISKDENISDNKWKWVIVVAAFVSFGLSIFNDYALDDFIVLVKNNFTQNGFSGIWNILSKDTFAGMTESDIMVLSGGRYRPLSLVTFAVEHQLWGNNPFISHLINVSIYAITGILLYSFLKKILTFSLKESVEKTSLKAALITLLFITLPAHSESVINIKGRDDLMCLMFFLMSVLQLFKYTQSGHKKNFIYSSILFFFSLMSKETAITFLLIFPLILYYFTNSTTAKKTSVSLVYFSISLLFLLFRYLATKDNQGIASNDVLNNPFVNATTEQKFATIFLSWFFYLRLLVFPVDISYDYNFNQIPLTDFSDYRVLLSICIYSSTILFAFYLFKRKSIYSFSVLFYLITFSILSNLIFNIGTIFADRFIYIPSLAFCILFILGSFYLFEKISSERNNKITNSIGIAVFFTVILLFSIRNIKRCSDWKDNNILFIADTKSAPRSAKVQLNAGIAYINLSDQKKAVKPDSLLNKALYHLQKGIEIYPNFIDGYMNMGVVYNRLNNMDQAEIWWNKARKINPQHQKFSEYDKIISQYYLLKGLNNGTERNFKKAVSNLNIALSYDTSNIDIIYNLGGAYFMIPNHDSAKYFFWKTLERNPDFQKAKDGLQVIEMQRMK